jgi:hypothetical protein
LIDGINFLVQAHIMGKQEKNFFDELNGSLKLTSLEKQQEGVLHVRDAPKYEKG